MKQKIFPSVMAKNEAELKSMLQKMKRVAKTLHLDVADGKFVPSHSLDFYLDLPSNFNYIAHLMLEQPQPWIEKYGKLMKLCIPHFSAIRNFPAHLSWMKRMDQHIAIALNPELSLDKLKETLKPYLPEIEYVLILTVHPGFYGSQYLKSELEKIKEIKKMNPKVKVIVDGGMNPQTITDAQKAGADYFVSGSYVTLSNDPKKAMEKLQKALK